MLRVLNIPVQSLERKSQTRWTIHLQNRSAKVPNPRGREHSGRQVAGSSRTTIRRHPEERHPQFVVISQAISLKGSLELVRREHRKMITFLPFYVYETLTACAHMDIGKL